VIVILDNGERYSAHEISFIDIGSLPVEPMTTLILKHARGDVEDYPGRPEPFVIAIVESILWRKSGTLMPVARLWENVNKHLCEVGCFRFKEIEKGPGARGPDGCRLLSYSDYKTRADEIEARPWTPEECPCTCVSGEMYELARKTEKTP
jgi:hypothetical protein